MISLLKSMFKKVLDIFYWRSAIVIAKAQVSAQYKDSLLGALWSVIQPVIQMCVYALVFKYFMKLNTPNYLLYIISTMPVWNLINQSLMMCANSILTNADVITRCTVSKTLFPISTIFRASYTYFIYFISVYLVAIIVFDQTLHYTVLLVPFYIILIILIIIPTGIAISFVSAYIRDTNEILTVLLQSVVWLTPVMYPISIMPEKIQFLCKNFNPFCIMITPFTKLIHQGVMPDFYDNLRLFAVLGVSSIIGIVFYKLCRRNFVYYL